MGNFYAYVETLIQKIRQDGIREAGREIQEVIWAHYMVRHIVRKMDISSLRDLQLSYEADVGKKENSIGKKGKRKYFAISGYMIENLRYLYSLKLQKTPPSLHILDIGTGFGYFPFVCRHFGHTVLGVDILDFPVFNEAIQILNVPRKECRVMSYHPLPDFGERFELVTCLRVCFDRGERGRWGIDEWQFFLNDLRAHHLKDDGRVFLRLNYQVYEKNPALAAFFIENGATIKAEKVYFPTLCKL